WATALPPAAPWPRPWPPSPTTPSRWPSSPNWTPAVADSSQRWPAGRPVRGGAARGASFRDKCAGRDEGHRWAGPALRGPRAAAGDRAQDGPASWCGLLVDAQEEIGVGIGPHLPSPGQGPGRGVEQVPEIGPLL